jgi:hypothetical protein
VRFSPKCRSYTIRILLFVLLAVSKIEPSDVAKLNGYWEISSFDKGEDKDYSINGYDYFEIGKNKKGFGKK